VEINIVGKVDEPSPVQGQGEADVPARSAGASAPLSCLNTINCNEGKKERVETLFLRALGNPPPNMAGQIHECTEPALAKEKYCQEKRSSERFAECGRLGFKFCGGLNS
jgi:hypothetical protein